MRYRFHANAGVQDGLEAVLLRMEGRSADYVGNVCEVTIQT